MTSSFIFLHMHLYLIYHDLILYQICIILKEVTFTNLVEILFPIYERGIDRQ